MRTDDIGARLALHSVGRRPPVSCESAELDEARSELRLRLLGAEREAFTLVIARWREGVNCYRRAGALALSYREGEHSRLVESYFTFLTRSLADLRFEALADWARAAFPRDADRDPLEERVAHVREGQPYSRGTGERWAQFFSAAHRGLGESVRFLHRMAGVQHQDPECLVFPEVFARPLKFIKYPWASRTRWPFQAYVPPDVASDERERRPAMRIFTTGMGEREVILGGNAAVRRGLQALAADPWHEMVSLAFTCTPQIIGDDLRAAIRSYEARSDRPLLHAQDEREHPARPVVRLLRRSIEQGAPGRRDEARFNLVGFLPEQLTAELAVLRSLGLELGVSVLPDIHLGDCERFLDAGLQVLNPQSHLERFQDELFRRLPVPVLDARAPLGWRASRTWAGEVAGRMGRAGDFERVWGEGTERLRARWDGLRERSEGHRVGFVVAEGAVADLASGVVFSGLPLWDALREMGFSLDLLVREGLDASGAAPGDRILRFATPRELREGLRLSEARVFYTEYNYDWRLVSTGKAGFSFHDFTFGAAGAVRNLAYLLGLSEATFASHAARQTRFEDRWRRLEAEFG